MFTKEPSPVTVQQRTGQRQPAAQRFRNVDQERYKREPPEDEPEKSLPRDESRERWITAFNYGVQKLRPKLSAWQERQRSFEERNAFDWVAAYRALNEDDRGEFKGLALGIEPPLWRKGTARDLRAGGYRHVVAHSGKNVNVETYRHPDDKELAPYRNSYSPEKKKFKAEWIFKTHDRDPTLKYTPEFHQLTESEKAKKRTDGAAQNSEIIWAQYKAALKDWNQKNNDKEPLSKIGNLARIHQSTIINADARHVIYWCHMDVVEPSSKGARGSGSAEPDDADFWALLGTENGRSAVYLLIDHGVSMGAAGIKGIDYKFASGTVYDMWINFDMKT